MKATPYLEQVFHLIIRLLKDQGHEQIAEQLEEIYQLPEWIQVNNPLLKKGLTKIVKEYVKNNEKMLHYYQNRVQGQQNQQVASRTRKRSVDSHRKSTSPKAEIKTRPHAKKAESPKVSKLASPKQAASPKHATQKTSAWMSKFQKPKTLEEINQVTESAQKQVHEEVVVNHTKTKKHKKAKIESSQYESQEDSFELQPKKKLKKQMKEEKKAKKQPKVVEQDEQIQEEKPVVISKKQEKPIATKNPVQIQQTKRSYPQAESDGYPKKFFSRINPDDVGPIRDQLRDNSFQAKAKFGQQHDHWGQFGYEKLKDTRGDSFKKTKGKLKNRAFQGALMDINKINSIPIE